MKYGNMPVGSLYRWKDGSPLGGLWVWLEEGEVFFKEVGMKKHHPHHDKDLPSVLAVFSFIAPEFLE